MSSIDPKDWLLLSRVVRFGETDPAGVMHFYKLLHWCHEAWEESLQVYGLKASEVFPCGQKDNYPKIALPIVHCQADFKRPIKTGDHLLVDLAPEKIDLGSFQVLTKFRHEDELVAIGLIKHLAIDVSTQKRCSLPQCIDLWLEACSLNIGIKPI